MIQIFLDGKPAIPRDNANIKLTSENQYFTKSATYTYEVEFPLAIAENRALFGHINRMDVTKQARKFSASLIVDAVPVLTGTAHITSVSETSVKLQLLGETAAYNYGNKMEQTYIDTMDLGDWYSVTWPDEPLPEDHSPRGNTFTVFRRTFGSHWNDKPYSISKEGLEYQQQLLYGDTLPWTAYPTYNDDDDRRINSQHFMERGYLNRDFNTITGFSRNWRALTRLDKKYDFCCQPYIWFLCELIAKATGYRLSRQDNALYNDPFLKRIFVANTSNSIQVRHCLPHWNVNDWWTQVEQTFGVAMTINQSTGHIKLTKRSRHYSSLLQGHCIDNVVDEYTSEMDDESKFDISSSNVGYADFECNPGERLSEYITNNAIEDFTHADSEALRLWSRSLGTEVWDKKYKKYIFRCADGHSYIATDGLIARGAIREVDMLRDRIVKSDSKDIDIELKFVPCRIDRMDVTYETDGNRNSSTLHSGSANTITDFMRALHHTGSSKWIEDRDDEDDDTLDIQAVLTGEEEEKETSSAEDVIYMAMTESRVMEQSYNGIRLDDGNNYGCTFTYHLGITSQDIWAGLWKEGESGELIRGVSLSLNHFDDIDTLGDAATAKGASTIDVNVRHCFRFIADRIPSPDAVFLIRNRHYVCEKIEADITTDGLNKLMTGYFYEIDL